jgi:hypothetical protein
LILFANGLHWIRNDFDVAAAQTELVPNDFVVEWGLVVERDFAERGSVERVLVVVPGFADVRGDSVAVPPQQTWHDEMYILLPFHFVSYQKSIPLVTCASKIFVLYFYFTGVVCGFKK